MQLWLTCGEQQPHPVSQICLCISILFLGVGCVSTRWVFPFSKATPCSHVQVRAWPAPASTSLPPTPFFCGFESPRVPPVPSLGDDASLPLCSGVSHTNNSPGLAPAVTIALRGPRVPPPRTGPDSCVSALFPTPRHGDCLAALRPTALTSLKYPFTVRAFFFVYCAQDKDDVVPLPPLFLF